MADSRRDTLRELEGGRVTDDMLEEVPDGDLNSIGTLLYHVALVEADWVLEDVLGGEAAGIAWPTALLPYEARDRDDRLETVVGETLDDHLRRLEGARAIVLEHFVPMSNDDFHRVLARERYDVSPAWVLHHLLQHEAEHRSHIAWVRDRITRA
jgi:hypothetical protein